MAGRISALESQKRSRDRVNVFLDGEFAFGLARLVAANLKTGTWLSDEAIAELTSVDGLTRVEHDEQDATGVWDVWCDWMNRYDIQVWSERDPGVEPPEEE